MKRLLIAISLLISIISFSQERDCEPQKFPVVIPYIQYRGAGVEVGIWSQNSFGWFGGMSFERIKKTVQKPEYNPETIHFIQTTIYGKTQYPLNRYLYLAGAAGLSDWSYLYLMGGGGIVIPINKGKNSALMFEGQYSTGGANVVAALVFAL